MARREIVTCDACGKEGVPWRDIYEYILKEPQLYRIGNAPVFGDGTLRFDLHPACANKMKEVVDTGWYITFKSAVAVAKEE